MVLFDSVEPADLLRTSLLSFDDIWFSMNACMPVVKPLLHYVHLGTRMHQKTSKGHKIM